MSVCFSLSLLFYSVLLLLFANSVVGAVGVPLDPPIQVCVALDPHSSALHSHSRRQIKGSWNQIHDDFSKLPSRVVSVVCRRWTVSRRRALQFLLLSLTTAS